MLSWWGMGLDRGRLVMRLSAAFELMPRFPRWSTIAAFRARRMIGLAKLSS